MRLWNRVLALGCAAVASVSAFGQMGTPPKVTMSVSGLVVQKKAVHVVLTVTFPEGLHGYQNPPSDPTLIPVTVKAADGTFKVLKVDYPKGKPVAVGGEPKPVNVYQGTIKIPITLLAPAKLGKTALSLTFGYQECNEQSCFPPGTVAVTTNVTVVKNSVMAKPATLSKAGR